jgi:hypothetical protein
MLDVRIKAYVVPLAEQVLDDLTPVIQVKNYADEDAVITGLIRIYRKSTDTLEYSSQLAVTILAHGTEANIAALSAWSPGAPSDDDYFILADIEAASDQPGPPIRATLGAFTFDIKPGPMGPAPAAHHTTHELGGMDELDLTGMSGELADPQPVLQHGAADHDGTVEATAHKGAAGGYCGLPAPLKTTQILRADGTPARPQGLFYENDLLAAANSAAVGFPWQTAAVLIGTSLTATGTPDHPGILNFRSIATVNSGYLIRLSTGALLLAGGESCDCIVNPQTLAGSTFRYGYHNSQDVTAPVDGVYIHVDPITNLATGRTMTGGAGSVTPTSFLVVSTNWYRWRIELNAAADLVTFSILDMAGATLWTDTLNANIPTTAGHEVGNSLVATSSAGAIASLILLDYLNLFIDRVLIR